MVEGALGRSLVSHQPVLPEILRRIPISAEIAVLAVFFATLIALPLGILSAVKQDSALDYLARLLSIFWISVPSFVIGTLIILAPAILCRYPPPPCSQTSSAHPLHHLPPP